MEGWLSMAKAFMQKWEGESKLVARGTHQKEAFIEGR